MTVLIAFTKNVLDSVPLEQDSISILHISSYLTFPIACAIESTEETEAEVGYVKT